MQVNAQGGIDAVMSDIMCDMEALDAGKLSFSPGINASAAQSKAVEFLAAQHPQIQLDASAATLMIYVPSVIGRNGDPQLVWQTEVSSTGGGEFVHELVLVDAHTGDIALNYSLICYAVADREIYHEALYTKLLKDEDGEYNKPWPEWTSPKGLTFEELVYLTWDYLDKTQQFYWDVHERQGYNDANVATKARLLPNHAAGASWKGSYIVIGYDITWDPIPNVGHCAQDDCIAHEFTHGVTQTTSGLEYQGESGAISEAFSDAWGEWIDLNDYDADDLSEKRWWFDEDYYINIEDMPYRSMKNPPECTCRHYYNKTGDPNNDCNTPHPDYYKKPGHWINIGDTDNKHFMHHNCGVGNKLCYLLTDGSADDPSGGGTFNGHTVNGMGIVPAAKLFYQCQYLLPPAAEYYDLYYALDQAAINLNLSSTERVNIREACMAVEIFDEKVGRWRFDEGNGQTVEDSAGNYDDGTLGDSNTVENSDPNWFEDPAHGWCLAFDGVDDYVRLPNDVLIPNNYSKSIAMWFYVDSPWVEYEKLLTWYDGESNKASIFLLDEGKIGGGLDGYRGEEPIVPYANPGFSTGEWHHICFICRPYDGPDEVNKTSIYFDGEKQKTLTDDYISYMNVDEEGVFVGHSGAQYNPDFYFKGKIDDLWVYNRALDTNEIRELSYISPADFNGDGIVNFIDYALFANAWQTDDTNFSLDGNGDVDCNDLKLFCEDWLWTSPWDRSMESMMMGRGMGGGLARSVSLAAVVATSVEIEQRQPESVTITQADIEEILDWLDEVWLDPDMQKAISEDDWLEFVEQVELSFE